MILTESYLKFLKLKMIIDGYFQIIDIIMDSKMICDNYLTQTFNVEIITRYEMINLWEVMKMGCKYGHIEVVKLLLTDERVVLGDCYNLAIIIKG